ncbi:MAG: aminotransferase class I/II-fold pyridoxal phosphate-dependent enzyme [Muribaculaceae bacterium]|nr:aminotransferase class I/II-fold pyridoxal phosphate-dependent enzyme [Muribaculaceae bacterium]
MIDGHGDDLFHFANKIKINFSTNIPQSVDHSGLLTHLAKAGAIFKNYPEPEPRSVEQKLAMLHDVDAGNVIVTNGATEAIYLLAHAHKDGKSAIIVPTFREYQDACRVYNHSVQFITSLDEIEDTHSMVWLCNPNNPTGQVYEKERLLTVIDNHPATVFIVDQAYSAFSVKEVLSITDIMIRKNVVMLHSLTKQFVVPGLRIGYAVGPEEILNCLRSLRMPWSVNSIAIEAALYLLENSSSYVFDAALLHNQANRLSDEMRGLGIVVNDTDCNFLLARLPFGTSAWLKSWLIQHYGILIRDASNFERLTARHFRVAAQTSQENITLIKALKEWISSFQ